MANAITASDSVQLMCFSAQQSFKAWLQLQ